MRKGRVANQDTSLAYAEIRLVLCKLLFQFNIKLCAESQNWADQEVYFVWDKPDLMVKLEEREQN